MTPQQTQHLAKLEALSLNEARAAVARGDFGQPPDSPNYLFASGVVAAREAAERDARDEDSLSISRKALRNSDRATNIAISAIVLSIVMAIQKVIEWYSKS